MASSVLLKLVGESSTSGTFVYVALLLFYFDYEGELNCFVLAPALIYVLEVFVGHVMYL